MTHRSRHPDKDIELAIQYAEDCGWRYKESGKSAHAWGTLMCVEKSRDGCKLSIWSTPRNCVNHANQIRRKVKQCLHLEDKDYKGNG